MRNRILLACAIAMPARGNAFARCPLISNLGWQVTPAGPGYDVAFTQEMHGVLFFAFSGGIEGDTLRLLARYNPQQLPPPVSQALDHRACALARPLPGGAAGSSLRTLPTIVRKNRAPFSLARRRPPRSRTGPVRRARAGRACLAAGYCALAQVRLTAHSAANHGGKPQAESAKPNTAARTAARPT